MHLEMSLEQMFSMRPFLGMAEYRTHVKGLYITGASTHPGGGIMGASGRNAARVILNDLERNLRSALIGQDEAIAAVCGAVKKSRAGLADPKRPHSAPSYYRR